ncbi:MAG TPA: hypothetical protein VFC19_44170 [Candidatus Limnocylindrales bacterium]|nr:hypothetical protein [Candidatus Limnocylindrales bacterium]
MVSDSALWAEFSFREGDADVRRYQDRLAGLASPDLIAWLHTA